MLKINQVVIFVCSFVFVLNYFCNFAALNKMYNIMIKLRLKEICKNKGVTLFSVSQKIGVTKPTISNIANGKQNPSLDTIERIANALEVPVWQLFASKEEVAPQPQGSIEFRCPACGADLELKSKMSNN